uniref:Uncharacterized protein n=1 Tax=Varanus komodoensis TaxID=61221 RepID=A0A8D2L4A6_VARKO
MKLPREPGCSRREALSPGNYCNPRDSGFLLLLCSSGFPRGPLTQTRNSGAAGRDIALPMSLRCNIANGLAHLGAWLMCQAVAFPHPLQKRSLA